MTILRVIAQALSFETVLNRRWQRALGMAIQHGITTKKGRYRAAETHAIAKRILCCLA